MSTKNIDTEKVKPWEKQPKKVTICFKTCFWKWKSWKLEKLRAHSVIQLLKVFAVGHFQDSNYLIWLKDPGFFLVPFYAPGPFGFWTLGLAFKFFFDLSYFFEVFDA
jgi:hypothetical protein